MPYCYDDCVKVLPYPKDFVVNILALTNELDLIQICIRDLICLSQMIE